MTELIDKRSDNLALSGRQLGRFMAWMVIVAPAIIDWLHGFLLIEAGIGLLSGLYRLGLLMLGFVLLLLRPSPAVILVLLAYVCLVAGLYLNWSLTSQLLITSELESTAHIFFLPACFVILSFAHRYLGLTKQDVIDFVVLYGKITALAVVASLVLDIGVPTYSSATGSVYGFGTQSYYVAGNVLGLTLVVSLAVALHQLVRRFDSYRLASALLIYAGAFCVGSRTGMIISTVLLGLFLLYFIFLAKGQRGWRSACAMVMIPLMVFGGIKTYELVSQYSRMAAKVQSLVAGEVRSSHSDPAWDLIESKSLANKIGGDGYQVHIREFARYSPKKNVLTATAESDPVDVIGAYGWIGLLGLYLPYGLSLFKSAFDYVLNRALAPLVAFSGLALLVGHSIIAGHVVLNSKSTQFACIFIFLALASNSLRPRALGSNEVEGSI